jgi:hypothetical protein
MVMAVKFLRKEGIRILSSLFRIKELVEIIMNYIYM